MKITFLGTRGEIEAKTDRHRRHTAALIEYQRKRVMIDCGGDWLQQRVQPRPEAIVLTHAHPDHADGLRQGVSCAVYATQDAWNGLREASIREDQRHLVEPRAPFRIGEISFEAFTVEHSTRCPAVGYRIMAGQVTVFYVPDVVYIHEHEAALQGVRLYIGDGATLERSFVRRRGNRLIGHTPVRTQVTWCEKHGVPEMIVTHCGSQIVEGDERSIAAQLREWGQERGVEVSLAYDGRILVLR